jgi:hypothetical protein
MAMRILAGQAEMRRVASATARWHHIVLLVPGDIAPPAQAVSAPQRAAIEAPPPSLADIKAPADERRHHMTGAGPSLSTEH